MHGFLFALLLPLLRHRSSIGTCPKGACGARYTNIQNYSHIRVLLEAKLCFFPRISYQASLESKTSNPLFCREGQRTLEGRGLGSRRIKATGLGLWILELLRDSWEDSLATGGQKDFTPLSALKCESSSLSQKFSESLLHTHLWIGVVWGSERMEIGCNVVWLVQKKSLQTVRQDNS